MTFWNKIILGAKFIFGGFEPATDYLCSILNKYLASGDVSARIQNALAYVQTVLGYMIKYKDFCPGKWLPYYEKLITAVKTLCDALEDNKVTVDEIVSLSNATRGAISEWMED